MKRDKNPLLQLRAPIFNRTNIKAVCLQSDNCQNSQTGDFVTFLPPPNYMFVPQPNPIRRTYEMKTDYDQAVVFLASSSGVLRPSSFAVILFLLFLFILVTMASTPKHMATFH